MKLTRLEVIPHLLIGVVFFSFRLKDRGVLDWDKLMANNKLTWFCFSLTGSVHFFFNSAEIVQLKSIGFGNANQMQSMWQHSWLEVRFEVNRTESHLVWQRHHGTTTLYDIGVYYSKARLHVHGDVWQLSIPTVWHNSPQLEWLVWPVSTRS